MNLGTVGLTEKDGVFRTVTWWCQPGTFLYPWKSCESIHTRWLSDVTVAISLGEGQSPCFLAGLLGS